MVRGFVKHAFAAARGALLASAISGPAMAADEGEYNPGLNAVTSPISTAATAVALNGIENPVIREMLTPAPPSAGEQVGGILGLGATFLQTMGPQAIIAIPLGAGMAAGAIQEGHKNIIRDMEENGVPGFKVIRHAPGVHSYIDASGLAYGAGIDVYNDIPKADPKGGSTHIIDEMEQVEAAAIAEAEIDVRHYMALGNNGDDFTKLMSLENTGGEVIKAKLLEQKEITGFKTKYFSVAGFDFTVGISGETYLYEKDSSTITAYNTLKASDFAKMTPEQRNEIEKTIQDYLEEQKPVIASEIDATGMDANALFDKIYAALDMSGGKLSPSFYGLY